MNEIAIRVEGLSKCYRIGRRRHGLWERLGVALRPATIAREGLLGDGSDSDSSEFWALRDISFEVPRGEVVGIIGRNGAGKSTLLKILSRITEPTAGRAEVYGRVGSLLEVGTGFHPDLTGRENVYLNGSLLGMRRKEIDRRFDEIVAFSGVEKFLETPVKHYSSGMYVRLAFAVAAHLDTEILFVDEVLAVGDAEFQRKCLGRMRDVATCGRTVLFVSHNASAVRNLCQRGLLFDQGRLVYEGSSDHVIGEYHSTLLRTAAGGGADGLTTARFPADPDLDMQFQEASIVDASGVPLHCDVPYDGPMRIELVYEVRRPRPGTYVCFCFTDMYEGNVWWQYDGDTPVPGGSQAGVFTAVIEVPSRFLRPGRYQFRPVIVDADLGPIDNRSGVFAVTLSEGESFLSRKNIPWPSPVRYGFGWSTTRVG